MTLSCFTCLEIWTGIWSTKTLASGSDPPFMFPTYEQNRLENFDTSFILIIKLYEFDKIACTFHVIVLYQGLALRLCSLQVRDRARGYNVIVLWPSNCQNSIFKSLKVRAQSLYAFYLEQKSIKHLVFSFSSLPGLKRKTKENYQSKNSLTWCLQKCFEWIQVISPDVDNWFPAWTGTTRNVGRNKQYPVTTQGVVQQSPDIKND